MAQSSEVDRNAVVSQGLVTCHAIQCKNREGVELERDLVTQCSRPAETEYTKALYRAETLRTLSVRYAQASGHLQQLLLRPDKVMSKRIPRFLQTVMGRFTLHEGRINKYRPRQGLPS